MNSSTQNTEQAESPKKSAVEYEAEANEANRRFADRLVKEAVEGLNRLAREKAAAKKPKEAA